MSCLQNGYAKEGIQFLLMLVFSWEGNLFRKEYFDPYLAVLGKWNIVVHTS